MQFRLKQSGQFLQGLSVKHCRFKSDCSLSKFTLFAVSSVTVGRISAWYKHIILILAYRKFPKYSDIQKICCNHSEI